MNKVVIYPGRFQPMLSHHAEVFKQLQAQFPDAEVYVGTSDKVEAPKSPFNFKEKQAIATAHGIPADRVLSVTRPYHQEDYAKYFDPANTVIIFAVGEKDLDRFPFNNMDASTGLDMTVRGDPRPKYYQKINTLKADPRPMSERGYITLAPTIMTGNEVASASAFRDALKAAPDKEAAKGIFQQQFGQYDDKIFNLIYSKVTGANMSEQINILRKLAGLPVQEAAPVEFGANADPKAAKFLPPSASSAKMSIANRFPKGADVNDPAVKKEQFIQALLRSPEALISEFTERLDPKDDNSLAVGQKLSDIMQLMNKKDIGVAGLPKDLKQFVLDLAVNAISNMDLNAGDDSPAYKDVSIDDEEDRVTESTLSEDLQADDGEYYSNASKFFGQFEAEWFDEEETSPDGMEIRGYIDGVNVMAWRYKSAKKVGGWGIYDDSALNEGVAEDEDDDDSWIPSEDEFDQEVKHGYKGRTTEGFSSESDMILAKVGSGELDAYDVMTRPQGPAQAKAAEIIQSMYDDVAIDHHLHPDDDFEKILDIVADQLDNDYGNSDADTHEAVEETANNAMLAAMAELRKLAGLR